MSRRILDIFCIGLRMVEPQTVSGEVRGGTDAAIRLLCQADAFYAAGKFARRLLGQGYHLVSRVRCTAFAFFPSPRPRHRRRGRPRRYGRKTKLRKWFGLQKRFQGAPSPLYDDRHVTLRYLCRELLWRPLGQLVRFVWVVNPTRGRWILLCTDLTLSCGVGGHVSAFCI